MRRRRALARRFRIRERRRPLLGRLVFLFPRTRQKAGLHRVTLNVRRNRPPHNGN
jgi:hypothetical protein